MHGKDRGLGKIIDTPAEPPFNQDIEDCSRKIADVVNVEGSIFMYCPRASPCADYWFNEVHALLVHIRLSFPTGSIH